MGSFFSSLSESSGAIDYNKFSSQFSKPSTPLGPKKYGASNALLQMDDFLSIPDKPKEPVLKTKKPKVQPKLEPVTTEKTKTTTENLNSTEEINKNNDIEKKIDENSSESAAAESEADKEKKKKRDRNAPCAPKVPREKPQKNRSKVEKAKELAEKNKKLSEAVESMKIESEPEPEPLKEPVPEPEKKEKRLNEIVQEYLTLAPINDKYRARNSELMNIVHDLVSYDRTVHDFKHGCGKQDKAYLKLEEMLTRCLLRFDNIERANEVLTTTRKSLIGFTQNLLKKLETKALDTPIQEPETKDEPDKKKLSQKQKKRLKEAQQKSEENNLEETEEDILKEFEEKGKEEVVDVDDVKIDEDDNASLSVEEIMKKKGKTKKTKKK